MKINPIKENFGAVLSNINLSELSDDQANEIKSLLYQFKIICIKDQAINEKQYIEFSKKIGDPVKFVDPNYYHPDYPEIFVTSNVKKDGKKIGMDRVGYYWHTDSSFMPTPLPITMLYAQLVPQEGGKTFFIDMHDAYEKMPRHLIKEIENKQASHEGKWRYIITEEDASLSIQEVLDRDEMLTPSSVHPTIITHPFTKKEILYINEGFTRRVLGMEYDKSKLLLDEMFEFIKNNSSQYAHKWSKGDVILWDNRSVIHKAEPALKWQPRMLFRIGISDGAFYENISSRSVTTVYA